MSLFFGLSVRHLPNQTIPTRPRKMNQSTDKTAANEKQLPQQSANSNEEEKDPLEEMLDRTGCKEIHYSLQECMYEHRDWRKCQDLVQNLRKCMLEYEQRKNPFEK